ncbi:hypothetical protein KSC_063300 [Ktedonobacter sp. SOSP1-52]|uniref:DUF499 domain-containing protein n=1 Tax=Ktedonobacter sp. SOSP1-52 TaxID=2778366 RepID=UPI001916B286|nr:DUF499 domain-containing protein [Ktedonobacter sp. SOSP1-52]GHO67438.1 hypothetical protein KSC_063300 [Ktedonobacter sp. SOSP1-52]
MAQSNRDRVDKALAILGKGLKPFIEREMQNVHGERWQQVVARGLQNFQIESLRNGNLDDPQVFLAILWEQWHDVFKKALGLNEKNWIGELRVTRNEWAHMKAFSSDDAERALDTVQLLLGAVSAPNEAAEVKKMKLDLQRLRDDEQVRNELRKLKPVEGQPAQGLRAWREVMAPQSDVQNSNYQLAEFAADLGAVHRGQSTPEYQQPRDFFQRTFLTTGLHRLLANALQRLSGQGGDPIIDLQTNFGGGKTHSLLALYHLFSGASLADLVDIDPLLEEVGVSQPPKAQRAVLVGHNFSPGTPQTKSDGTKIHTLWGELAWQLLGKEGFAMVAEDDRLGVSPGTDTLRALFTAAAPCLILIDELAVYVRQLHQEAGLAGGTYDANLSFVQSLTEAAKATSRTLVVATIPESNTEAGGESGQQTVEHLKKIFGRMDSPWRPANTEESFEIVRRRLFQPIRHEDEKHRDTVIKAFMQLYREQAGEFPSEASESRYEERLKRAYPIHPELFDRLYTEWSSVDKFQRTRGVLRLMAHVIRALWERQDGSLMIMPAHVPLDDTRVHSEVLKYLENNWAAIMDQDIDGPNSLPLKLDSENTNMGRYSACRRVARTIYMGSAPTSHNPNRGQNERHTKLGCVQPGENVTIFGDALRRLSDQSTHLYQDGQRYWYSTNPSVLRLAQERAGQLEEYLVEEELEKRLRRVQQTRGLFARVHPTPASSADIADEAAVRLVILKANVLHSLRDQQSPAIHAAQELLDKRGNASRHARNALIFLAADRIKIDALQQGIRQYLAWNSIYQEQESEVLNLDAFQRAQVKSKLADAEKTVELRIPETYVWLLVPGKEGPHGAEFWEGIRLQPDDAKTLALAASTRLSKDGQLISAYAATSLRRDLDNPKAPLWRGANHVSIETLKQDFANYLYLPRFKNTEVLLEALRSGLQSTNWERETFAYADRWDQEEQRYVGLKAGPGSNLLESGLLVKSEVAAAQFAYEAAERARQEAERAARSGNPMPPVLADYDQPGLGKAGNEVKDGQDRNNTYIPLPGAVPVTVKNETIKRRFYGSVKLNPRMMAGDAGKIMDEIVTHLTTLSKADVSITLEIQANIPGGVPAETIRTVMENSNTLKFESAEFEEE